jgi:hypothetical protein
MSAFPFRDLTGTRSGILTVKQLAGWDREKRSTWICLCDCGTPVIARARNITFGAGKSCGCAVYPAPAQVRPSILDLFRGIPFFCAPKDTFDIALALGIDESVVAERLATARDAEHPQAECAA